MAEQRFLSISQLTNLPAPQWLIAGMFEAGSLVMLAGPPGSYKSFLALDWILCMAGGRQWCGKPTVPCKVLYILGEGKASLLKRVQAWIQYHQLDQKEVEALNENFRVTFDVPQMTSKASVDNLLASLAGEQFHPSVIVIDTLARSFVGMDENSQRDAGMWIEQAERLRAAGHTVLWLHHTSKNTEYGLKYRGSSVILGAVDTAMTMQRDPQIKYSTVLTITKQKDHDEGSPMHFNVIKVKSPGNPEGSCVLSMAPQAIDERFSEEGVQTEEVIRELLKDESFPTDAARAKALAVKTGLSEQAAKTRISRKRVEWGMTTERGDGSLSPHVETQSHYGRESVTRVVTSGVTERQRMALSH